MAPLRNNRASHRANRGQVEHDIMEGLPVRQWRKQTATVSKVQAKEPTNVEVDPNDPWKELPMPRGSELYPPHSQALLRAARMGQFSKPPPRPAEDEKENGEDEDAEGEPDYGYVATKWAPVAKELELPEPEFLAKRRKGLPSLHEEVAGPAGTVVSMRKVKVRKMDAEGNATVFDVLAPEGVAVEGEIVEGEVVQTAAPAPGTVIEGVGVANAEGVVVAGDVVVPTPQRRRPPPPKRKMKGPGRGRKKKVMIAHGTDGVPVAAAAPTATSNDQPAAGDLLQVPASDSRPQSAAGEDSIMQDGDEGSEDEDEEGEEGEEGELSEGEANRTPSRSPSKPPNAELPTQSLTEPPAPTSQPAPASPKELSAQDAGPTSTLEEPTAASPSMDHEMTDAPPTLAEQGTADATSTSLPPPPSVPSTALPAKPPTPTPVAEAQSTVQSTLEASEVTSAPTGLPLSPLPPQPDTPVIPTVEPATNTDVPSTVAIDLPAPAPPADTTFVEKPAMEKIASPVIEANLPTTHSGIDGLTEPKGPDYTPADEKLPAESTDSKDNAVEPVSSDAVGSSALQAGESENKLDESKEPSEAVAKEEGSEKFPDGEENLLGTLEAHLENNP